MVSALINKEYIVLLALLQTHAHPSFVPGGVGGLFDLGPPACALKANMINLWKEHFVLEVCELQPQFYSVQILLSMPARKTCWRLNAPI